MIKRALIFALFACSSFAQTTIAPAERTQLAETIPHLLDTLYVLPGKGKELAALVRKLFESGKYDAATTPAALAEAISADLATANDRHLRMLYNAANDAAPVLTVDAWKARRAEMAGAGPRPRGGDLSAARAVNFGVLAVEVLPGNIGYLRMRGFMAPAEALTAISHAMALLENTEAVIVDVRNCPGGSADTVSYLASYFFGPDRRVLMNRYNRPSNQTMESTTVDVPGRRLPNVPLYILTGPNAASACESFAFTLQQWGRAKTIGEKTAGAGYNNMIVDLGRGLSISISIGTATHPKTNKQFEAVGVVPDIAVPADRALETAQAEARRALAPKSAEGAVGEVRTMERAWLDAYEKRDLAAMERILADEFVITSSDGSTQTKAEVLAALGRSTAAGRPAPAFTTSDVQGRVDGDKVTLTGRVTMTLPHPNGTSLQREGRYTDVYVRRDGRWQALSSRQERIAPTSAAAAPKLDDYVGKYGVREVTLRDGALFFQRTGARGGTLEPIGPDKFDLNGDVVVAFQRAPGGAVTSLSIEWKDGRIETVPRD